MPPSRWRSSVNRIEPSPRSFTASTLHLSSTRERISLTARQSEGRLAFLDFIEVPPVSRKCLLAPFFAVTHIVRVTIVYQEGSHVHNRGDRRQLEARIHQSQACESARQARPEQVQVQSRRDRRSADLQRGPVAGSAGLGAAH